MSLIARKGLFQALSPVWAQSKRFRGKINLRRLKPPHYDRGMVIELTRPWFINPKKDKRPIELCRDLTETKQKEVVNPFQQIIAGELAKWLENSRLIAFYHMNPMNADEQYKAYVQFFEAKMHFKNYGKKTMEMAVKDTKFETIMDFYVSKNVTVFSPEIDIRKLLKITKKFKQLTLLCAIVDGKLVTFDELVALGQIPNLQTAQAQLVQVLNSAATCVNQQLNSHQNVLVSQLEERMKQLKTE